MSNAMEVTIRDEKLRYDVDYIEYHVPSGVGGSPLTILAHPPYEGNVAILFIPNEPIIHTLPDFVKNTVTLYWPILGTHIRDFAFYTFNPDSGDPQNLDDNVILNIGPGYDKAYLGYAQGYLRMFCNNSAELGGWTRGIAFTAAEDAKELGYVEGDGFDMLKSLDQETQKKWLCRLKLDAKKVSVNPYIKMRAIFEENLKEAVAFLPFAVDPGDGSVSVKEICLEKTRRDWRHVRRILFRSVHELSPKKQLWVNCKAGDEEFVRFLHSCGYKDLESNFWVGEYST